MKLVLDCSSSNENYDGGCSYALVDLTPGLAKDLLAKHCAFMRFRAETGVYEAYWFDLVATFFDAYGDGVSSPEPTADETERVEQLLELLGGEGWVEVPADFVLPESMMANAECQQVVVCEDGVFLFCYPKHTSVHITTSYIPVEVLRLAAITEPAPKGD